jgi:predicted outer membrane repeat protein
MDLVVYNNNNAGAGSLRQMVSDNNALGGGNRVVFSNIVTGTITLSGGELLVTRDVDIVGPGDKVLTVSGNNTSRVLHLTNATVNISGLTVANGMASSGGGIFQDSGTLKMIRCAISNNYASSFGGGIAASGIVALADCTILRNRGNSSDGTGIGQIAGSLTLTNCTFLQNSNPSGRGGALEVLYTAGAIINNCTFVSNNATFGGGLINYGIVAITNCTFIGNSDGGIHNTAGATTATVRNTILAANTALGNGDCSGIFISGGYNLIGAANGSTGWTGLADQVGSTNAPIDALLGPLQNNGGSTPTMAPLPSSPAVDKGNSPGSATDQRGRARPFTNAVPPATLGDHSDIGAVELNFFPSIVVTNLKDSGDGSLRQAIAEVSSNGVITFAAGMTGVIALTTGEIDAFHTGFSLQGPGAKTVTVSGGNSNRVFSLFDGTFNISGLTLANGVNTGQTAGRGGNLTISSPTTVNLDQCRIMGGRSVEGAGIWNAGALALTACTVDNNFATNFGGGIYSYFLGSLKMTNCTVASNSAGQDGGVYSEGAALARNCTFAYNSATVYSGGVISGGGTFELASCLIASNTAPGAPDVYGPFISDGYNLIGNTNSGIGFGGPGDQLNLNALIGPLGDYGGPTPTVAPRAGSPAIDRGNNFGLTTDQRGFARALDDPTAPNADGGTDAGAFEVDPNFRLVDVRRSGSDVALSLLTVLGKNYRVDYTNELGSGAWALLTNNAPGNGYLLWVTNYGGATQASRFYRGQRLP